MYIKVEGKYGTAGIYAALLDTHNEPYVLSLLDNPVSKSSKIAIMPNVFAEETQITGLTMALSNAVMPNLLGNDPGCGVLAVKLDADSVDLTKLNSAICTHVPAGDILHRSRSIIENNTKSSALVQQLHHLSCQSYLDMNRVLAGIGTLGHDSHFIELAKSAVDGALWLLVHAGSGTLGEQVISYWKEQAVFQRLLEDNPAVWTAISALRDVGKTKEVERVISRYKAEILTSRNPEPAYLAGDIIHDFITDLRIVNAYADSNRTAIASTIMKVLWLNPVDSLTTVHNYIKYSDTMQSYILRKGAVSAEEGERFLLTLNMRDGTLICLGKGNKNWNCSAPSGSGRFLSRAESNTLLSMEAVRNEMRRAGIYIASAEILHPDESPEAYRDSRVLEDCIQDTLEVSDRLIPVYNYKAGRVSN